MGRPWVKLWVNEWLDGTTRHQMSGAQRAFWIDLLAMAGRSRIPGVVCTGKDGEKYVGLPIRTLSALDAGEELDIMATLELFRMTGKITIEITAERPVPLYAIAICNWDKYQSEYQRQKPYRKGYKSRRGRVTNQVTPPNGEKLFVEEEGEGNRETEKEKEERRNAAAAASGKPTRIELAFHAIGHRPFGDETFKEIWADHWSKYGPQESATDLMEDVIQRCQAKSVTVPRLFYVIKKSIEKNETKEKFGS